MLLGLNMEKPLVTRKMRLSVIWFLGEDAGNAVAFGDWCLVFRLNNKLSC